MFGRSRIPNNIGSRSRIFLSESECPIGSFLRHSPKLEIPVEMVQFVLKLLLKQISCCVPGFPLIVTAKFNSLDVKESDILPPTPQPCLQLPVCTLLKAVCKIYCCKLSVGDALNVRFTTNGMCAKNNTHICGANKQ